MSDALDMKGFSVGHLSANYRKQVPSVGHLSAALNPLAQPKSPTFTDENCKTGTRFPYALTKFQNEFKKNN